MIRAIAISLLLAATTLTAGPVLAQTPAPHHARRPAKAAKAAAPQPAGSSISMPSTDFSNVERADDDPTAERPGTGSMRPVMAPSGNIGLGTGF